MESKNNTTIKKIVNIVSNIILFAFLVICVFSVFLAVFSKKDVDGTSELFGYQLRIVTSESMAKCELTDVSDYKIKSIPFRSMVFVKKAPDDEAELEKWYSELEVGDVVTFRYVYTTQVTITHRIVRITEKQSGGYIIELAGDNKSADTNQLTQIIDTSVPNSMNYIIGKVTGQNFIIGFIVSLLQTPLGIIFVIIVPCFIIILLEVFKIAGVLTADKKKREQEEAAKKDSELEELRQRLAQLEQQASAASNANESARPDDANKTENTTKEDKSE